MGARIAACAPFFSLKFLCCCLFGTHPFYFALPPFTILLSLPGLTARVFPCAFSPNSGSLSFSPHATRAHWRCFMPDTAQHLLGQQVDGRFPLRKLLGVSPNSAAFLTTVEPPRPTEPATEAAIKLIPEDPANSDLLLERWQAAAALAHPGLLRLLHFGRCAVDGAPCLYIVSELADEDLGQLLPQRALTSDEARGMLAPVLAALDFLHEHGLVHAGLKPSNIHAIGDNIKLSSDRILPAGESASTWPLAAPFAAPESVLFPASDIWSLGNTLCQTLAQALPGEKIRGEFSLPELPAPFAEIVRAALVEDATLRITLDSVRSVLDPNFVPKRKPDVKVEPPAALTGIAVLDPQTPEALMAAVQPASAPAAMTQASAAAAAGASTRTMHRAPLPQIDPLSVPLSPVEPPSKSSGKTIAAAPTRAPIPVSTLPHVNATIGGSRRAISPNPDSSRSNRLFWVAAAAAILLAILVIPRMLLRSSNSSTPATRVVEDQTTTGTTNPPAASPSNSKPATAAAAQPAGSAKVTGTGNPSSSSSASKAGAGNASLGSSKQNIGKSSDDPVGAPANDNASAPAIVRKVLPEVSEKARSTISGTVRVNVRVQLNPDGTVSSAELNTPASSDFFANLALKAARQWQFATPATASGEGAAASTLIRFDFTQTATSAYLP